MLLFGSKLAWPAIAVGALALAAIAVPADAAPAASGTGTITVNLAAQASLAENFVIAVPASDLSVSYDKTANTVSVAYSVTGVGGGAVNFGDGGATVVNITNGKTVDLVDLTLDLATDQLVFTPEHGSPVAVLDLTGSVTTGSDGVSASALSVDAAGAADLDGALATTAFHAGSQVGSFTSSF